jgi:hypothetical protein
MAGTYKGGRTPFFRTHDSQHAPNKEGVENVRDLVVPLVEGGKARCRIVKGRVHGSALLLQKADPEHPSERQ